MGVLRILWKKSCLGMFFGILYVSYEFVWAYNVLSLGIETGLLGGCCIKDLSINSSLIKQMYPSAAHLILHLLSSICLWTCGVVSSYISLFRPMFNINLIFNLLIYIYTPYFQYHIYTADIPTSSEIPGCFQKLSAFLPRFCRCIRPTANARIHPPSWIQPPRTRSFA